MKRLQGNRTWVVVCKKHVMDNAKLQVYLKSGTNCEHKKDLGSAKILLPMPIHDQQVG